MEQKPKNPIEQAKEARLQTLKSLRQIAADFGFDEVKPPRYEDENDKNSDILISFDTFNHGIIDSRLEIEENKLIIYLPIYSERMRSWINELVKFQNSLQVKGVKSLSFKYRGEAIEVPRGEIRAEEEITDTGVEPPSIPLDKQKLEYDLHSGKWFGSPKK